jgi:hypothetical protein
VRHQKSKTRDAARFPVVLRAHSRIVASKIRQRPQFPDLDAMAADYYVDEAACYADGCCAEHMTTTPGGPHAALPRCLGHYLVAAGSVAWAAAGILGVIGGAVSPDPVSKIALVGIFLNAEAGMLTALGTVYMAYQCHYNIMTPALWADLSAARADFRLKAVAAFSPR